MAQRLKLLRFDQNDLPILGPLEIEERAEVLLEHLAPQTLVRPGSTSIPGIIEKIQSRYGVHFVLDKGLGITTDGRKIRGRINIPRRIIWIDVELRDDRELHRFNFTVAHEIGHLALHRHRPIRNYDEHSDSDEELRMLFDHAASTRGLADWQSNRYAAAVLMPRETVRCAIITFQTEQPNPIRRYLGSVYLDDSPFNRQFYAQVLSQLMLVYQVSRSVARIRLKELELLIDRRPRACPIGGILGELQ
jgi:hypothetical protein